MLNHIRRNLITYCQINPGDHCVVGVSGGPDSVCLLYSLVELGYKPIVGHLNHNLRPAANVEAQGVKEICTRLGLEFFLNSQSIGDYAKVRSISVEEAARILRYQFLFQLAEDQAAQAVIVGHNADDQVETVLMHLLRGVGLDGLRGMQYRYLPNEWSGKIPLLRPLLSIWREEITVYLMEKKIDPFQDLSNLDNRYLRNRIRNELIPSLRSYNPRIKRLINQTAALASAEVDALEGNVDRCWCDVVLAHGDSFSGISISQLFHQPIAIQRRLLRRVIHLLAPSLRDLDYQAIDRLLEQANRIRGKRSIDITGGMLGEVENDILWIRHHQVDLPVEHWPLLAINQKIMLDELDQVKLQNDWVIKIRIIKNDEYVYSRALGNQDPYQAFLNPTANIFPLVIRTRKPGDRISPLNMKGHSIRISDLMINEGLPRRARSRWPLLASREEILWVPGFRLSEVCRLKSDSENCIHFHIYKEG